MQSHVILESGVSNTKCWLGMKDFQLLRNFFLRFVNSGWNIRSFDIFRGVSLAVMSKIMFAFDYFGLPRDGFH